VYVYIDSLARGVYNYTCYANDTSGNSISDMVIVTVLPSTRGIPGIPGFELLFGILGLLSLILVSKINRKFPIH